MKSSLTQFRARALVRGKPARLRPRPPPRPELAERLRGRAAPVRFRARPDSSLEVVILAGGRSRRMGRDKARLRLGGLTFLTRIRRAAEELGLPVRVQRRDRVPGCGPLGGITTVLGQPGARAVLFLACDQPMVSAELLRWFVDRWRAHPAVALSLSTAGQLGFPLILPRSSAPTVAAVLARKQYSLQALARRCGARKVSLPRADLWQTANINSPEDLRVSRRVWRAQSAVSK